jgi:VCBS repeat-containing protein
MVVNGIIFDGGLSQPLGLSFSPWGELFVANYNGNSVSRYSFDPGHNPTAGEPLTGNGMNVPVGVAFSPSGELFVSSHLMTVGWQAPISRWRFGPGHIPLPNGWFLAPSSMGDLKFSPVGAVPELADITIDQTNPEGAWGPMPQAFDQADHSLTITSEPSGFLPLGTTLVTYTARDAAGNVSVATRRVTVQNVRPTAQDVAGFTPEDTPLGVFLFANDTGGETLQYLILTPPTKGTLSGAGPSLIYTPLPDKTGPDSFTWAAFDGSLSSAPAKVQITIMPVNDAPIANGDAYSVNEDGVLTVPSPGVLFNDTDVDGDSLRAFLVSNPAHGNLSLNLNGSFTYRPEPNFHGTDQFSYKANDGTVDSGNAVVMITVNPVNDAPVASNDAYITAEDTPLVVAAPGVLANDSDVDGDPLHAVLFSGPIHGTLTLNPDGSFTYTPAANYNGTDSFTYLASDGSPTPGSATVTLTITPVNDAPVAANDLYTTSEDTLLSVAAPGVLTNDTDVEGTALTAVLVTGPSHGTLTLNANGSFSYTPAANYNGSDSFTYKASDGSATSAVATVNLTVTAVNDAPVAAGVAYTFPEDSTLSPLKPGVLSNASDIDGDTLTAVLVSGPSHGILTLRTDGSFDYTPALNYNGSDSFTFRAKDPSGAVSAPATVNLTITAVNDAPVASGDSYTATKNKDLIVAAAQGVLANDSDVDSITLTATKVAGPSHGTVTLNTNGSFTYTPTQGYVGADSFTYKVSDGLLDSNEATVSIDVQAVNTAPVANDDNKYSFSLKKGNVLDVLPAQSILKNDTDAESDPLTAKLVSGPARGTLVLNSDGSFRYTAAAGETGGTTVTFTYVANDAKVNSNTATVTITINK